jgi:hypothetical protein
LPLILRNLPPEKPRLQIIVLALFLSLHKIFCAITELDYETLTVEYENKRQRLDLYLRDRLGAALERWTDYGDEESENSEESEQTADNSSNEECIQIEISDSAFR